MEGLITAGIVILVILIIIAIIVAVIKNALENAARKYIGKGLSETVGMLSEGLKSETTLPKSIVNLSAVYQPKINRDFPEVGYSGMEAMAKNTIIGIFNALEAEDISMLPDCVSDKLKRQAENTIADNISIGRNVFYDNVKIHKIGISEYKNQNNAAEVAFQISLQYNHYEMKEGKLVSGSKTEPEQAVYQLNLCYNQDSSLTSENVLYGSNCPNCGAPASAMGKDKFCPYCGTALKEIADRLWQADSYSLIK